MFFSETMMNLICEQQEEVLKFLWIGTSSGNFSTMHNLYQLWSNIFNTRWNIDFHKHMMRYDLYLL